MVWGGADGCAAVTKAKKGKGAPLMSICWTIKLSLGHERFSGASEIVSLEGKKLSLRHEKLSPGA